MIMEEMRKQILKYLEKNSRVALGELAVVVVFFVYFFCYVFGVFVFL